jgi:hypothetical protein
LGEKVASVLGVDEPRKKREINVLPAESETESRRDETTGEGDVTSGNGKMGDHLTKADLNRRAGQ